VTLQLHAIELELKRKQYDAALHRLGLVAEGASRQETWLVRKGEILEMAGRPQDARQAYTSALAAIDTLPQARRWNRAVLRLQEQAQAALTRLPSGG
jgi:predicted negative regulator of RcsB-dependent stress response